jgi:hypothetical protein
MLKRLSWRVQPIEQIRKRKQRHKEMQEREKQFAEFVRKEQAKKKRCDDGKA